MPGAEAKAEAKAKVEAEVKAEAEAEVKKKRSKKQMVYRSFTEMAVWQKAHNLSGEVFSLSAGLPRSEDYGLTSQIRNLLMDYLPV